MLKKDAVVCVIGLGYVGLPLAEALARSLRVIGFDSNAGKIEELKQRFPAAGAGLFPTTAPEKIGEADFVIICVPTPVTATKEPDISYVAGAAGTAGRHMKAGSVVVLESTVYPGLTEEIVRPILEKESGLTCGRDFKIGYSPERINPGDEAHTIATTTKVVAGMDEATTELLAELYGKVTPNVFKTRDIRTAEAAKVIENIQRDLNIALMNELSIIFERMGLNTRDVLNAAATKWNFHAYSPGLVGGHCIPVDPYYLVHKSRELGYQPQVILAGRSINDNMPRYLAEMTVRALNNAGKGAKGARVLIAGLTYKEDVADIRETPVRGIIKGLKEHGATVCGYDPLLQDIENEFGIEILKGLEDVKVDAVILTVVHQALREITPDSLKAMMNRNPVLIDVRGFFNGREMAEMGFHYRTL